MHQPTIFRTALMSRSAALADFGVEYMGRTGEHSDGLGQSRRDSITSKKSAKSPTSLALLNFTLLAFAAIRNIHVSRINEALTIGLCTLWNSINDVRG